MNKKLGMMALTGAMALVACSQGPSGTTGTTTQSLTINLTGVASAPITIKDASGAVVQGYDSKVTPTGTKLTLNKGSYTVTPGAVTGYSTPAAQTANLNSGDVALNFAYVTGPITQPSAAKTVNLISIKDQDNVALSTRTELNDNKVATLFAAQTEESVCVIAKVTDAANAGVANSAVKVGITDLVAGASIAVADGCGSNITTQDSNASVTTDANGFARFRLFATYPSNNIANPVKILLEAKDASGNQLTPLELKGYFLNMSHLYVQEGAISGTANNTVTFDRTGAGAYRTKTRVGDSTGFVNVFGTRANPLNIAAFNVFAFQKQPQGTPQYLPTAAAGIAPGYVQYDLTGTDAAKFQFINSGGANDSYSTDANFGNATPFQPANPQAYSTAATSYRDYGANNGVQIQPRAGVTVPADRPLDVQVKATYVFETTFGTDATGTPRVYDFPLKDVTIDKKYQSSFLTINKTVDNHVLTWGGPERTLAATGAKTAEPLIANYTITVTNTSQTPAYNVTIKDSLPAEIGVATDQLTNIANKGGTYDTSLHQITWNYTTTPSLVRIDPGQSVTLTFPIYARQKPGFQWAGDPAAFTNYVVKPRVPATAAPFNPYPDPYLTRNGANGPADVTAAFFPTPDVTSLPSQVVTDFNPPDDRADVWVVRPEFKLTKVLLSENPMAVGASAFYRITLNQIDQIGAGGLYADLASRYPYEFTKTSTATTAGDTPKANPYGTNLKLADAWDYGLDFTNATAFSIFESNAAYSNGTGTAYTTTPTTPTTGRSIAWTNLPLFERDDFGVAQVALTGSVPSPTADPQRPNGWLNCAYLNPTDNLNQPSLGTTDFQQSYYTVNGVPAPWAPNTVGQTVVGSTDNPVTLLATGVTGTPPAQTAVLGTTPLALQAGLESCASVVVVNNQTSALTFTNRGEYQGAGEPSGSIIPGNARDGYPVGQSFFYKFDSQNTGTAAATGVNVVFARNNDNVTFPVGGTYQVYTSTDNVTYTAAGTGTRNADGTVTFTNVTVPAGGYVRYVLSGTAQFSGTTNVTGTLTYQPSGGAQVILNTQEVTTVN